MNIEEVMFRLNRDVKRNR